MSEHRTGDGSFSIGSDVWPGASKVIEEMGELLQVLGKLVAIRGQADHWDGSDLTARLHEEIADVEAALAFFVRANGLDANLIGQRQGEKVMRFWQWQTEGTPDIPTDRSIP